MAIKVIIGKHQPSILYRLRGCLNPSIGRYYGTPASAVNNSSQDDEIQNSAPSSRVASRTLDDMLRNSFHPATSIFQMMNAMDRLFDATSSPLFSTAFDGLGGRRPTVRSLRLRWDVAEDKESFKLRMDVPGMGKEDVRVTVEDGELVIQGGQNGGASAEEEGGWPSRGYGRHDTRVTLPENANASGIKAQVKNGVLLVTIPKEEMRKEVYNIEVS